MCSAILKSIASYIKRSALFGAYEQSPRIFDRSGKRKAANRYLTASQAVTVLTGYLNAWISQHIIFDMKNQMYAHLQKMSHAFFTGERQGDIITRMNPTC